MKNKGILLIIIMIIVVGGFFWLKNQKQTSPAQSAYQKISPQYNDVREVVSTTGTVEPQNRLEVKPQVNGRLEEILVKEGDHVSKGQTIAWMSSTERAALLDAARNQDKETLKYWQEVYKPTPLIAPINGEVIVRDLEPGQTINTDTAVVVLSDRLIVQAQVDETDIGKVKIGQDVEISLDAYADKIIAGRVNHIAYESTLVNNVIIYEVNILPLQAPTYFRSGMGANVMIIAKQRKHVLTLPLDAINKENGKSYVQIIDANGTPQKKFITLGLSDEQQVEILSGLNAQDQVLDKVSNYQLPKAKASGGNPFMPVRPSRK